MKKKIEEAIKFRNAGDYDSSSKLLKNLLRDNINNPDANYQMAWNCDCQGLEREAVAYYERALDGKLSSEDRLGAFVGLGSTYRNLGLFDKSCQLFDRARSEFPDDHALRAFHTLSLYNRESYQQAFKELFELLLETTNSDSIKSYRRALIQYSQNIDAVSRMDF